LANQLSNYDVEGKRTPQLIAAGKQPVLVSDLPGYDAEGKRTPQLIAAGKQPATQAMLQGGAPPPPPPPPAPAVQPQMAQAQALRRPSAGQIAAENAAAGPVADPRALMRAQARRYSLVAPRQGVPRAGRMPVG
jgi:hypothetical protein